MIKMRLHKEEIDKIFETGENQPEMCLKLYEMVYPDFKDIDHIIGWPHVNKKVAIYLFDRFIEWDQKHDAEFNSSLLWMNKGFGTDEKLGDWELKLAKVVYKNEV